MKRIFKILLIAILLEISLVFFVKSINNVLYKVDGYKIGMRDGRIYWEVFGRIDEYKELFFLQFNKNIETTQTPEETHKLFFDYLKKEDFDSAVKCCFKKRGWDEIKKGLEDIEQTEELDLMISDLSKIDEEITSDTIATYKYTSTRYGIDLEGVIEFRKNRKGVWLIESF